jgi:hypothetical protein
VHGAPAREGASPDAFQAPMNARAGGPRPIMEAFTTPLPSSWATPPAAPSPCSSRLPSIKNAVSAASRLLGAGSGAQRQPSMAPSFTPTRSPTLSGNVTGSYSGTPRLGSPYAEPVHAIVWARSTGPCTAMPKGHSVSPGEAHWL